MLSTSTIQSPLSKKSVPISFHKLSSGSATSLPQFEIQPDTTTHRDLDLHPKQAIRPSTSNGTELSFHFFPKLPTEIQLEIWEIAAGFEPEDGPRIQRILPDGVKVISILGVESIEARLHVLNEGYRWPSLLQVCQNSRAATLKNYMLWPTEDHSRNVYVNKKHDIFYFGDNAIEEFWILNEVGGLTECPKVRTSEERLRAKFCVEEIKKFAFDANIWKNMEICIPSWFETFQDMEQLVIVYRDHKLPPTCCLRFRPVPRRCSTPLHMSISKQDLEARLYCEGKRVNPKIEPPRVKYVVSLPKRCGLNYTQNCRLNGIHSLLEPSLQKLQTD